MIPTGLIQTWIETKTRQDLIRALVSLAQLEGWTCTVQRQIIPWAEWADRAADPSIPASNEAITRVFFACTEGKLDTDVQPELDLATCWAFEGDAKTFRSMWAAMLERQNVLPGGITRQQWLDRYPRALSQYTL